MHGEQEVSNAPRVTCTVVHCAFVGFVAWLYFGSGYQIVLGSFLNTGSEIQRYFFKNNPAHKGVLYTGGMSSLARHINYFGDSLWVTAWAILTRNIWSIFIPILITAMFVFVFIPSLTKHLKSHYGEDFDAWAKRTKAFVPFLY